MDTHKTIAKLSFLFILGLSVLTSCSQPSNDKSGKKLNSPNSGGCIIAVDETLEPIVMDIKQVFDSQYTKTKVKFIFGNEDFLNKVIQNDSISAIISPSELNPDVKKYFDSRKLTLKSTFIARDAIALVGNNSLKDSILTWQNVESIFNGTVSEWDKIYPDKKGKIQVVFSANGSSTVNYLQSLFLKGNKVPSNFFALDTSKNDSKSNGNPKVIEYVKNNPNSIGVIGVSWISNPLETSVQSFRNEVKTLAIYPADSMIGKGRSYKPYQAYIALQGYPFIRKIYIHNREGRTGLASGFASYAAGPIGQKIILKSGLLPANAPIRLIEVKK